MNLHQGSVSELSPSAVICLDSFPNSCVCFFFFLKGGSPPLFPSPPSLFPSLLPLLLLRGKHTRTQSSSAYHLWLPLQPDSVTRSMIEWCKSPGAFRLPSHIRSGKGRREIGWVKNKKKKKEREQKREARGRRKRRRRSAGGECGSGGSQLERCWCDFPVQ